MNKNYIKILDKIKEYKKISIFRHISPDGDACFSQMALYTFLKENFKDKRIKNCGFDSYELFNNVEKVNDSFIKGSLAIVLDTSDKKRIDDQRVELADYIIKIDHHPPFDDYGDLNYVNVKAAAACELLADILFSSSFKKYYKSPKVCEYLYSGMLTDTLNFKVAACTSDTLKLASTLVKNGEFKMSDISDYVFASKLDIFSKITKLRTYLKTSGHLAYLLLNQKDLDNIGLSYSEAKNNIAEFGNIQEINVWCFFVYNKEKDYWEGSIRSKRKYIINGIARRYGGGGHANASGVRELKITDCKNMINDLKLIANDNSKSA